MPGSIAEPNPGSLNKEKKEVIGRNLLGRFWPLLNSAVFLMDAFSVLKIGSSQTTIGKISFPNSVKRSVEVLGMEIEYDLVKIYYSSVLDCIRLICRLCRRFFRTNRQLTWKIIWLEHFVQKSLKLIFPHLKEMFLY